MPPRLTYRLRTIATPSRILRTIAASANGSSHTHTITSDYNITMHTILKLPLVAPSSRLTQQLLPDPLTPTPSALVSVDASAPSLLRRSRGVGEGAHFSYTTPLVLPFPYELSSPEGSDGNADQENGDHSNQEAERQKTEAMSAEERQNYAVERARKEMERVERLMRPYEVQPSAVESSSAEPAAHLFPFLPEARKLQTFPSARLLGISRACINDCLPHLDVGDGFDWIQASSGKDGPDWYSSGPMAKSTDRADVKERARCELSDFLSGRLIGAQFPTKMDDAKIDREAARGVAEAQHQRVIKKRQEALAQSSGNQSANGDLQEEDKSTRWQRRAALLAKRSAQNPAEYSGYVPWSNAYSGHQFGQWAGQLGDGRAITLMETSSPSGQRWEIQLKGAGRTPYSRFADGLATLSSSVREYLASEALAGLGIPTSRALCVIGIPDVSVTRESRTSAAVTTRLAPLWVRVGSFEHHAVRGEWESLRLLGEFVCREGFCWREVGATQSDDGHPWAERLIRECIVRNAETVAQWQVYGFMHGVMNTDNISILGLTIDFGPFAFMDIFDRNSSSNKSDGEGRYSYNMQPTAALFVMEQLVESLSAIVAIEKRYKRAVRAGELLAIDDEEMSILGKEGKEAVWPEFKALFMDTLLARWEQGWRRRLGLQSARPSDRAELIDPLLDILEGYMDLSTSVRRLAVLEKYIKLADVSSTDIESMLSGWLEWDAIPSFVRDNRRADAQRWCARYIERLQDEGYLDSAEVAQKLRASNPAFILRNWVTDEVAHRLQETSDTNHLAHVLDMCTNPFAAWDLGSDADAEEGKRLCAVGTPLAYHMPSCSS